MIKFERYNPRSIKQMKCLALYPVNLCAVSACVRVSARAHLAESTKPSRKSTVPQQILYYIVCDGAAWRTAFAAKPSA